MKRIFTKISLYGLVISTALLTGCLGDEIRGTDDGSGSETTDSTIPGNSVIDARVFEALNLDLPELASVKAYYESDQYYLAAQALLNYFRTRTQVNANVNLIAPSITAEEQARADWALPVTGDAQDGYRFWVDGLKLCQTVKQNIRTCHIPVVMLAPDGGLEEQITGIEAGADSYLPMPLSITLLAAKVQNLLKARYRMRHHYSDDAEIDPDKITSKRLPPIRWTGSFSRRRSASSRRIWTTRSFRRTISARPCV